ncbi:MAG: hypothetical protein HYR76_01350 [Ignavibacteria bacterium]|nr:hypothetical protein [Ignavibacteria bacterium]MBI3765890.1 hypothetical protein [Ignavibacteriales bacterium]
MNRPVHLLLLFSLLLFTQIVCSQTLSIGGRAGLSIFSYGGSSAGIQLGPTFDYEFSKGMLVGSDLLLNTQDGTPIEWSNYYKYFIDIPKTDIKPYVNGGFGLWFYSGGSAFGLQIGGGSYFRIAPNLYVPADIQFGPVFTSGSSTFFFAMSSGIRYILPNK